MRSWSCFAGSPDCLLAALFLKKKTTQAVKTTPHIDQGKEGHFGTEYRKTYLPALCSLQS
jgi:hypothetical protein